MKTLTLNTVQRATTNMPTALITNRQQYHVPLLYRYHRNGEHPFRVPSSDLVLPATALFIPSACRRSASDFYWRGCPRNITAGWFEGWLLLLDWAGAAQQSSFRHPLPPFSPSTESHPLHFLPRWHDCGSSVTCCGRGVVG